MKILKTLGFLIAFYVFIVVGFESLLGYFQPANEQTLSLTVTEDNGNLHQRVLSRIEHKGKLYVAVNHWPRAWYQTLQEEPGVTVAFNDVSYPATAVVVSDSVEFSSVESSHPLGLGFRILTGFPPRHFVRLDGLAVPVPDAPAPTVEGITESLDQLDVPEAAEYQGTSD